MFYGLGSAGIYDHWEASGNPGWGWKDIQAAAKRVRSVTPTEPVDMLTLTQGTKFVGNPDHTNDNTYMKNLVFGGSLKKCTILVIMSCFFLTRILEISSLT